MSGRGKGKTSGKKAVSKSSKAGLQFPVGRIARYLKKGRYAERIGAGARVYLAAVLEYLAAEVLELAGNAARDNKKTRIIPRHIQLAVRNDEELSKLLAGVTIAEGGVLPNIHSVLLPKKSGKGKGGSMAMAPLPARHRLLRGPALLLAFLLALISHVAARQPSLSPAGSAAAAARRRLQQVTGGGVAVGPRCPQLSKQLLMGCARDNLIMFAVLNEAQLHFGWNWLHFVKQANMTYYVVAAADAATSAALAAAGEPCFEFFDEEAEALGLEWGQEGWRRVTWSRVFVLDAIVEYGLDIVVSDVDVVWFRDPAPLLKKFPKADLLVGLDHGSSANDPGDSGLEVSFHPNASDFNTGAYLLRSTANTSAWAHAFAKFFGDCPKHDQVCCYWLVRTAEVMPLPPPDQYIYRVWHGRITMAAIPVSIFESGHTLFLQQLHKTKRVEPYNVHATWTYGGLPGKRARLRDLGLWAVDPPAYYESGDFVAVDLQLPEPPGRADEAGRFNEWQENEDMIVLHLRSLQAQLQQAYVGMALAVAAGRAFILPKLQCYCEKTWYGTVRCRIFDAQEYALPVTCPTDYVFQPLNFAGGSEAEAGIPIDVREAPFLEHPKTPQGVKESVLTIQPSAALTCTDCVQEERGADGQTVLLVPPALRDGALLPLLQPYRRYRVWRLSFAGVGSAQRAFGGFGKPSRAAAFDRRMDRILTTWCCRREDEAPRYHQQDAIEVPLTMTPDFSYSELAAAQ
ncbi:Histone H2A [Micractinium conductrix]|uniref:Histone H2A n=1 Tax=Micractinium conductrix TaxID=554055 RepID=A0A2P6VNJ7_9CHLO|nr:Histone H2A [Micractinium conductrix]|eukprot:PSC75627.1 Histone H2A [Micractinium conductrix]